MNARNVLIALAIFYEGNWNKIYNAIVNRKIIEELDYQQLFSKLNSEVITIIDEEYPSYLKEIRNPPFVLFYKGDISLIKDNKHNLAVVGSRVPDMDYLQITERLVTNLNPETIIVSGVAKGIDAIAHQAALNSGKKTIGIIGSGLDVAFPSENASLYEEIAKYGLLISEYPNGTAPDSYHFPWRNRLIAAFSSNTLVTHAGIRSGTMITATFAIEQNKNVLCLPSGKLNESGCNLLIKEGAFLVENEEDIEYFLH